MQRWMILAGATLCTFTNHPALAQKPLDVICTGVFIDVDLKPGAHYPMAVIYDEKGGYTCLFDRGKATDHDPLKPCYSGAKCRIVGTYTKVLGYTYYVLGAWTDISLPTSPTEKTDKP